MSGLKQLTYQILRLLVRFKPTLKQVEVFTTVYFVVVALFILICLYNFLLLEMGSLLVEFVDQHNIFSFAIVHCDAIFEGIPRHVASLSLRGLAHYLQLIAIRLRL